MAANSLLRHINRLQL